MEGKVDAIDVDGKKLDIKLYYFIGSQPVRALLSVLDLANVKYEANVVNMLAGDHKKPEFLAVNPAGVLPTLVINGKVYGESAACLRLLASVLPGLASYYPNDIWKRHAIDAALDFNGTTFRPKLMGRNMALFGQMSAGGKVDEALQAKIDEAVKGVHVGLKALEDLLTAAGTKFCTSDEPTIADLQIYHQL